MPHVHWYFRDYSNDLLWSLPSTYITRLQRLQNLSARLVFEVDRKIQGPIYLWNCLSVYVPKNCISASEEWEPFRLLRNRPVMTVKPCSITKFKYLINVPKRQLRSSNDYLRLVYPITRVLAGNRTFTVAASKEWNKFPVYIKQSLSVSIFKSALKICLFPWCVFFYVELINLFLPYL